MTNPNGTHHNPKKAHKPHASGIVYESLFVRHWDYYLKPERSSIFSGIISLDGDAYTLKSEPKNLLPVGSGLECPIPPFGGADDFDISPDGKAVTFVSKTPNLNPANNTQTLVYLVPFDASGEPLAVNNPDFSSIPPARGASSAPTFSPDGKSLAYLQMAQNGYESDINKIYIARYKRETFMLAVDWDVSPGSIKWSEDAKYIFAAAEHEGRYKLYKISIDSGDIEEVWNKHTVSAYEILPDGKFLLTINSLTESPRNYIFDPKDGNLKALDQPFKFEQALVHHKQVEDFWFPGADGGKVHGFIVKPSFFNSKKKYRMAFFIHGGPQG